MELSRWTATALRQIYTQLQADTHWSRKLAADGGGCSVHLAVLLEPFLSYVLDGSKPIESRFTVRQTAPFRRAEIGDILLLKEASGPVVGVCEITETWFFDLGLMPIAEIRSRFALAIRAEDDAFWQVREAAGYATLVRLGAVSKLSGLECPKRDRRGWVVLRDKYEQLELPCTP
jgi:hypothetical protein